MNRNEILWEAHKILKEKWEAKIQEFKKTLSIEDKWHKLQEEILELEKTCNLLLKEIQNEK